MTNYMLQHQEGARSFFFSLDEQIKESEPLIRSSGGRASEALTHHREKSYESERVSKFQGNIFKMIKARMMMNSQGKPNLAIFYKKQYELISNVLSANKLVETHKSKVIASCNACRSRVWKPFPRRSCGERLQRRFSR
ncbi:hypothetical protein F2Q70_00004434 [Brassica cretica]|uniref:Uncharacterized protein n=1 Tax=Brassica cretica TaxID=69181 RepID=A0A3N6RC94_BRACR|nr:hypothetical protein F2Q70_00004434 [Brassica cretica]KAF3569580.1 hypothetical protein DY000_02016456 [Brassica cretica]